MLKFDYVEALLNADKDVPYRTCTICKTPMSFTLRNYQPTLISCKCRKSGETALCRMTWDDLRTLLTEGKDDRHLKQFPKGNTQLD
jgi:hypothetical protein